MPTRPALLLCLVLACLPLPVRAAEVFDGWRGVLLYALTLPTLGMFSLWHALLSNLPRLLLLAGGGLVVYVLYRLLKANPHDAP